MDLLKSRALILGILILTGCITADNAKSVLKKDAKATIANSVAVTSVIVAEPILAPAMQEAVPITDR